VKEGNHIHIGDLPTKFHEEILVSLKSQGVDPSRFVHVTWTPSLWEAFKDLKVSVYINSFPIGGGRTMIEAMGAGIPIILHQNNVSRFYGGLDIAYREAFTWRSTEEFSKILASLTPELLARHSNWARKHFEANHNPELLEKCLEGVFTGVEVISPPPLRELQIDHLSNFFKLRQLTLALTKAHYEKEIEELNHRYQKELAAILSSKSWTLTKPLRWFSSLLIRTFKR
jgi:hypothetical protein